MYSLSRNKLKQAHGIKLKGMPQIKPTRVAITGFGARGRLALCSIVAMELTELWQGKSVNKNPRAHDYFEVLGENESDFQLNSNAALNAGLPGPVPLDTTGLTPEQRRTVEFLTDIAGLYARILMADRKRSLAKLERENIASALLFAGASRDGTLRTDIACGPRNTVGEALEIMTREALRLAKEFLPCLDIRVHSNPQVADINLSNPKKPILTLRHKDGRIEASRYDLVLRTTNMTSVSPVTGVVADNAFTGIPDPEIFQYLHQRNLMRSGLIKPGAKIFIVGSSPSAFDQVCILLTRTGIVKLDDEGGWTNNSQQSRQYQGFITILSRPEEEIVRSTQHFDVAKASDRLEKASLFTPEMLLSLQMQEGLDQVETSLRVARLVTAVYCDKVPQDIEPPRTTNELLAHMARENDTFTAEQGKEELTETCIFQACLQGIAQSAFGLKPAEKRAELERQFPFHVRDVHASRNAQIYSHTPTSTGGKSSRVPGLLSAYAEASPFPVHHLIMRLTELGVIKWEKADYKSISWLEDEKQFKANDKKGDALICSRYLTDKPDSLSKKISAQMKHVPGGRIYEKGRFIRSPSGIVCHLMEMGNINNLYAVQNTMPRVVNVIRLFEDMLAHNIAEPVSRLMEAYRITLPSESEFSEQAALLRVPFVNSVKIQAFADVAKLAYPTGKEFSAKMQAAAKDRNVRRALFREIRTMRGDSIEKACRFYETCVQDIQFVPLDLKSFEEMSPDFSQQQIEGMKRILDQELASLFLEVKSEPPAENPEVALESANVVTGGPLTLIKLFFAWLYILIILFFKRCCHFD